MLVKVLINNMYLLWIIYLANCGREESSDDGAPSTHLPTSMLARLRTALLQANTISSVQICHWLCFDLFFYHNASGKLKYNTQLFCKKLLEHNTRKCCLRSVHFACHYSFCLVKSLLNARRQKVCFVLFMLARAQAVLCWSWINEAFVKCPHGRNGHHSYCTDRQRQAQLHLYVDIPTYTHIDVCACPEFLSRTLHRAFQQVWALISHTHLIASPQSHSKPCFREELAFPH